MTLKNQYEMFMRFFKLDGPSLSKDLKDFLKAEEEKNEIVEKSVQKIINDIKIKGFSAVCDYSKKFDHFNLTASNVTVDKKEINELAKKIDLELSNSLELAVERIKNFHF